MECISDVLSCADMFTKKWLDRYKRLNRYIRAIEEKESSKVIAYHCDENTASSRVMQKCGMICEGVLRKDAYCNCGIFDRVNYAILYEDYIESKENK